MNLSTIVVLLTMAVSLLSTPNLSRNPQLQAQAVSFANEAIQIASVALRNNPTSSLPDVVSTSSVSVAPVITAEDVVPPVGTGTGGGEGTVVAPTEQITTPMEPTRTPEPVRKISVTYAQVSSTEAWVTVKNTLGDEAVRIHTLAIPSGTLAGIYRGAATDTPHFQPYYPSWDTLQLLPGETMILQYEGAPTGITYDAQSIEGVMTGWDIEF